MPSGEKERIRVLVIDDSPFVCQLLKKYLESEGIGVAGVAHDGENALRLLKTTRPDVVTLDLEIPGRHGLEVLDGVMREMPLPVVVVSGGSHSAAEATSRAMELGAVDFLLKYHPSGTLSPDEFQRELVSRVRAAAGVHVLRTWSLPKGVVQSAPARTTPVSREERRWPHRNLVVIGSSTGGPLALRQLLGELPPGFEFPVVVVQHMPEKFTRVLAEHLDRIIPNQVKEAVSGDRLEPGAVLVAPGGSHLLVQTDGTVRVTTGPAVDGHRPSIDVTMQSAALSFGRFVIGVVLTGMGKDGTEGLRAIRAQGGRTLAQSPETCVVAGMPGAAIEAGLAERSGDLLTLARFLRALPGERRATPAREEMSDG